MIDAEPAGSHLAAVVDPAVAFDDGLDVLMALYQLSDRALTICEQQPPVVGVRPKQPGREAWQVGDGRLRRFLIVEEAPVRIPEATDSPDGTEVRHPLHGSHACGCIAAEAKPEVGGVLWPPAAHERLEGGGWCPILEGGSGSDHSPIVSGIAQFAEDLGIAVAVRDAVLAGWLSWLSIPVVRGGSLFGCLFDSNRLRSTLIKRGASASSSLSRFRRRSRGTAPPCSSLELDGQKERWPEESCHCGCDEDLTIAVVV